MLKAVSTGIAARSSTLGSPQVVATRGGLNNGSSWGNYTNGRPDTFSEGRRQYFIGPSDVSQLQLAACGYYMSNSSNGEVPFGNDVLWNASIEDTANTQRWVCFANGQSDINIQTGCPVVLTDPLGITVAAGGNIYVPTRYTVQSPAHLFPSNSRAGTTNDNYGYVGSFAALDINTGSGTLSIPGTGNCAAVSGPFVQMVLGIPKTPHPSVCIFGDSIAGGEGGDASGPTATGGVSFIMRGLELALSGGTIPVVYGLQTTSGDFLSKNLADNARKRAMWKYYTHIIDHMGTNDILGGASLATLQANQLAIWNAMKRTIGPYGKPLKVTKVTIMPRTTSTDTWQTAANQTGQTGFTLGGIRDQFNTWLATQVGGGLLDQLIDINLLVEDQNNKSKWVTTGAANYATADGTHPSTAICIIAQAPITTWGQSLAI